MPRADHENLRTTIAAIVPLHNKAPYIERALLSACEQTQGVDEIIVVDDASSDGGAEIAAQFARRQADPVLRLLKRAAPGPGGYAARNLAIEATEATWIAFLDADDAWAPGYISHVRALLSNAPGDVGAVFTARRVVRPDGGGFVQTATPAAEPGPRTVDFDGYLGLWRELKRCPMWTSATIIRRDILLKAGLFPAGRCRRGGDKDTWLRAMRHTHAIASPFVGATYYLDVSDQVTRAVSVNQRHCLCDTLAPMIAQSRGAQRDALIWIYNSEMQKYARWQFGKAKLKADVYRGFYVGHNPLLYLTLRMMSSTPLPLQRTVRGLLRPGAGAQ